MTDPAGSVISRLRSAGCVFAEDEAELLVAAAGSADELDRLVAERVAGRPLEQVLGWASFCGLRVTVQPGVFVPRRRTELLVREAVPVLRPGDVLLELCCGSGAIALALATAVPGVVVYAVDSEQAAVRSASGNLRGVNAQVLQGDLYQPLPAWLRGRVAVLVANAPYVPTGSIGLMPPEARQHEPRVALDGGPDGLDVQRRIIAEAPDWLAVGGLLIIETGRRQAPSTAAAMQAAGLSARTATDDELDATAVLGVMPGDAARSAPR
jgi:release factor glutamine methyltransferase